MIDNTLQLYKQGGGEKPWFGYLGREYDTYVGTCAFKSVPYGGKVEIAYFTFPGFEGRGIATKMVEELLKITRATDPSLLISAQTLPMCGPSVTILQKLGFKKVGEFEHAGDGLVWTWERRC